MVHKLVRSALLVLSVEIFLVAFLFASGCHGAGEVAVPEGYENNFSTHLLSVMKHCAKSATVQRLRSRFQSGLVRIK